MVSQVSPEARISKIDRVTDKLSGIVSTRGSDLYKDVLSQSRGTELFPDSAIRVGRKRELVVKRISDTSIPTLASLREELRTLYIAQELKKLYEEGYITQKDFEGVSGETIGTEERRVEPQINTNGNGPSLSRGGLGEITLEPGISVDLDGDRNWHRSDWEDDISEPALTPGFLKITPGMLTRDGIFSKVRGIDRAEEDMVTSFFGEAGKYPLLNAELERIIFEHFEEEKDIRRNIDEFELDDISRRKMLESAKHKLTDDRRFWLAVPEGQTQAFERLIAESRSIKEMIVLSNLRLVVSIAKKNRTGLPFTETMQEGVIGLMHGIELFDFKKEYKLSTYVTHWIRQRIHRAAGDNSSSVRLPIHVYDFVNKARRIVNKFYAENGEGMDQEKLWETLKENDPELTRVKFDSIMRIIVSGTLNEPASFDIPINEEGDTFGSIIPGSSGLENEVVIDSELREALDYVLSTLPWKQRRVLQERYGLIDGRQKTLEEVGVMFGLTRERIRQIEGKSLETLRHPSRARQLRDYI